jgi:protein-S-isoprenylcysteine O-methyltransferase Ste14
MSHPSPVLPGRDLGPGVFFPPPFLFVLGFSAGGALSRLWPIAAPWGSAPWIEGVGLALIVLGLTAMFTGIVTFRLAHVTVMPNRPAAQLVTRGIYAYTRNPMYVGLTALYLGGVIVTSYVWALFILPLVLVVLYQRVIRREERYLSGRFPVEYAAYRAEVRRWV